MRTKGEIDPRGDHLIRYCVITSIGSQVKAQRREMTGRKRGAQGDQQPWRS
jgi:hypothetical protein